MNSTKVIVKVIKQPYLLLTVILCLSIYIVTQHSVKWRNCISYGSKIVVKNELTGCEDLKKRLQEAEETAERLQMTLDRRQNNKINEMIPDGTSLFKQGIPRSRKIDRDLIIDKTREDFERKVTIIVYGGELSDKCVIAQLKQIRKILHLIKIIVAVPKVIENLNLHNMKILTDIAGITEGKALNRMLSLVKTEYFLYLSGGAVISEYNSIHSPGWLYHALNKIPELDFIGASFLLPNASLKYAQLDIQCHRLKMCYWEFSQSYEYKYSVGDMMVCEETSSSFMGRTSSISKVGRFDETLHLMVTTDFFFRGKGKIIAGLRPEVFFHVSKICAAKHLTPADKSLKRQDFMDKYSLKRIKDSFGHKTDYPKNPKRSVANKMFPSFSYRRDGGVNIPQATETLRYFLSFFDDFFKNKNITYIIVAGVALGGIKMRNVLPWDTGDIDTGFFGVKWERAYAQMQDYAKKKRVSLSIETGTFQGGPPNVRCIGVKTKPVSYGVHNDIYSREYWPFPKDDELMMTFVHDRYIPVIRGVFKHFREKVYGIDYLKMQSHHKYLKCKVKGHHACLPDEFSMGGGHWSDFYCH